MRENARRKPYTKAISGYFTVIIGGFFSFPNLFCSVKVAESCSMLCNPMDYTVIEFSRPEYWSGKLFPSPGDLPNLGIEPRSPTLQADSLPAEPQGKSENAGAGCLSLLQRIFPTQESNNLLHCRWILYQLSYQGSLLLLFSLQIFSNVVTLFLLFYKF